MTIIRELGATARTCAVGDATSPTVDAPGATNASALLPPKYSNGAVSTDDLETAIAVLMIESSRQERALSDAQREVSARAQEAAHARKIASMRELAHDTLAQALLEGILQGASAVCQGVSATKAFSSTMKDLGAKGFASDRLARESTALGRSAKLWDAGGHGLSAAGTMGSMAAKSAQERDREAMAVADRDVDRAKGSVDSASSESKRAQDDVREAINVLRQYLNAKSQAAQAAILRG